MNTKEKLSVSWSGGKDSSYMLWELLSNDEFEVAELHTVINSETQRVGLHGVRRELIEAQAQSIGLPLKIIEIESSDSNENFERATKQYYSDLKQRGINHVAFGDIFLEDLKTYRDGLLDECGIEGVYPIWKMNTRELAQSFIDQGFKSVICSCDASKFTESIAGQHFSSTLINQFQENVDPCGENGEFHSFVFDGPIFRNPISILKKEITEKSYQYKDSEGTNRESVFHFCDLVLN